MIRYARLVRLSAAALLAAMSVGSSANVAPVETPQLLQLVVPGGKLRAFINPAQGAELAGLEVLRDSRWSELLYRGLDDRPTDGWSGKAPILWPAVGRNFVGPPRDNHFAWALHGSIYPMAIHGFARDQPWRLVGRGRCDASSYVKLVLRDNSRTRRSYPFGFELDTEYRLWRDSLYIRQSVRSDPANGEGMPFSIGNHITLRVPLLPGSEPGLTTVSTPATAQVITDSFGRPTGQVVPGGLRAAAAPGFLAGVESRIPIPLPGWTGLGAGRGPVGVRRDDWAFGRPTSARCTRAVQFVGRCWPGVLRA